jgi:hypothetical protein
MDSNITKEDKIAFILRGHVRDSLDDDKLYIFLKQLVNEYPNIEIYVYTFEVKSTGKIYKENKEINNKKICEEDIKKYLRDIMDFTRNITIDKNSYANIQNDRKIGNISRNKFLHMWASIFNAINFVKEKCKKEEIEYSYIINMRMDYFQLVSKFPKTCKSFTSQMRKLFYIDIISEYIKNIDKNKNICLINMNINLDLKNKRIKNDFFIKKKEDREKNYLPNIIHDKNDILYGVDNIFAGKIDYLYKLTYIFVNEMDIIFDFLEKIMDGLDKFAKANGGCGGPHEAVFPLFIKNNNNLFDN